MIDDIRVVAFVVVEEPTDQFLIDHDVDDQASYMGRKVRNVDDAVFLLLNDISVNIQAVRTVEKLARVLDQAF